MKVDCGFGMISQSGREAREFSFYQSDSRAAYGRNRETLMNKEDELLQAIWMERKVLFAK